MDKELIRKAIISFLKWNDPNGSYTDEDCKLEGIDLMAYEKSINYFYFYIFNDIYTNYYDNPGEVEYEKCIAMAKENNIYFKGEMYIEQIYKQGFRAYQKIISRI